MSSLSEFSLIQRYFEQLSPQRDDVLLGIGDDCALLQCPADHVIAVSIDTLVEGVHFFPDVEPEKLGYKSLAVGLSDLAAMGAKPVWFTLALTLPEVDQDWLKGFSSGLSKLAKQHHIQLVGGDTTRGPLTISIQVHGFVDRKKALKRSGAHVGDMIYVTGSLGDAGAGLQLQLQQWDDESLDKEDRHYLVQRLEQPTPRLTIGQNLSGLATAAIDISDGLLADLGHIVEKSGVGARLDIARLPLSPALSKIDSTTAQQFALQSGDDYELCFTVSPQHFGELEKHFKGQCTRIGMITDDQGIYFIDDNDNLIELTGAGYDHFSS
ncbi:MAG: thiamine-phosphate kinase [Gammaproteobacteria bacterium]|nr:MAG: thiamine-phosphate kinase [Gammaproteobacteria bacterium]